jgi:hypothetical protein
MGPASLGGSNQGEGQNIQGGQGVGEAAGSGKKVKVPEGEDTFFGVKGAWRCAGEIEKAWREGEVASAKGQRAFDHDGKGKGRYGGLGALGLGETLEGVGGMGNKEEKWTRTEPFRCVLGSPGEAWGADDIGLRWNFGMSTSWLTRIGRTLLRTFMRVAGSMCEFGVWQLRNNDRS